MTTPWTVSELLELEQLEPGVVRPEEWARARPKSRRSETAAADEPVETSAPTGATPRGQKRRQRREDERVAERERKLGRKLKTGKAPKSKREPKTRVKVQHEGVRRALDPVYREDLFKTASDLRHARIGVQRVLKLISRVLGRVPEVAAHLSWVAPTDAFAHVQAAFGIAFGMPVVFRGGCDLRRGYGARGSELPQLGAVIRGRSYYSETSVKKVLRRWEEDGIGFRKPRLEPIPIVCPITGRSHDNRFVRTDVYLSREQWRKSAATGWLQPFVTELRRCAPQWLWRLTKPGRAWRKKLLSFAEAVALPFADRQKVFEERRAERNRRRREKARRIKREKSEKTESRPALERVGKKVPITPASSPTEKRTAPLPGRGKGRPPAGVPGQPPSGRRLSSPTSGGDGVPSSVRSPVAPPPGSAAALSPSPPSAIESATRGKVGSKPWSRHLDAGPPQQGPPEPASASEAAPTASKPSLSAAAQKARDWLRSRGLLGR